MSSGRVLHTVYFLTLCVLHTSTADIRVSVYPHTVTGGTPHPLTVSCTTTQRDGSTSVSIVNLTLDKYWPSSNAFVTVAYIGEVLDPHVVDADLRLSTTVSGNNTNSDISFGDQKEAFLSLQWKYNEEKAVGRYRCSVALKYCYFYCAEEVKHSDEATVTDEYSHLG